jgi:hypothetical protein
MRAKQKVTDEEEKKSPETDEALNPEIWNADAYRKMVKNYRHEAARALAATINYQYIDGGDRRYWSSVIFLRIALVSRSIHKILPDIDLKFPHSWWDFASFANLARSLFETLLFFRYFTEPCSNDEWAAKLKIMQLNDNVERMSYFTTTNATEQAEIGELRKAELIAQLNANPVIQAIEEKKRKKLLEGWRPSILTQREITTKFNIPDIFWSHYQFLSTYTHCLPMSFYRTSEHGRYGTENLLDRAYFIMHLEWITAVLKDGLDFYEEDMDEVKHLRPDSARIENPTQRS